MLCPAAPSFLALLVSSASPQGSTRFTPEGVAELRTATAAVLSPDGQRVAYTLSVPRRVGVEEDGTAWSELHVVDVRDRRDRTFVGPKSGVSSPSWTVSGGEIAFLAKRNADAGTCLYLIPVDGGEARRAVSLSGAIEAYDLAPDGVRVVCIAAPKEDPEREKRRAQGFRQEIFEEEGIPSELWVATLDGSAPARRVPFQGHPREVRWSPVDERLLLSWTPTTLVDDDYVNKRVLVLDAGSGEVRARIENPGKLGKIAWSPDGAQVALLSAADAHDPNPGRLALAPSSGGTPTDSLPGFEGDAVDFAWQSPNALLWVSHVGVWSRLEKLELAGGPKSRVLLDVGGPILTALSLARDGQAAALLGSSPAHPSEVLFMRHGDEASRRLTDSNPALAQMAFAVQEPVRHSARDGLLLEGVLLHPLERREGARVPLILNVHGGPEAHVSNGWLTGYNNPGQVAAARGFAVFQPNYRGSTGRGVAFSKLGQGDAAGKEFDDLVDVVDHLVASGLVDTEKVGVTGGSYGGYATGWCATRFSERFAAGVMMVGISNTISKLGTTDIAGEEYAVHALGRPWDDWMDALERSPIYYADRSQTPLLILHGKDDPRVNPGQSRELYRHLKLRGQAPVRLVLYPGEGHGNRKAAARLDYARRSLQWFEHYLLGPGGEMPPAELDSGVPADG